MKEEGHAEAVLQKSGSRTVVVGIADCSLRVDKQYMDNLIYGFFYAVFIIREDVGRLKSKSSNSSSSSSSTTNNNNNSNNNNNNNNNNS